MLKLTSDKGYVSLFLLVVIVFLSGIGLNAFYKTNSQGKIVRYEAERIKAVFLAEGGLEWAKASLTKDPDWQGGNKFLTNGKIQIEVKRNNGGYRVISVAESGQAKQIRFGDFLQDKDNHLIMIRYGEMPPDV